MKAKRSKYSIVNYKSTMRFGVTLVELMVTLLIATLVMAGIGVAMIDSIKGLPKMYERTEGNVINDAYVARATFDSVCRKASIKLAGIDSGGTYLEVYYYNDANSTSLNRYTQFRRSGSTLLADFGTCSISGTTVNKVLTNTITVANTINPAKPPKFSVQGSSVIMALSLIKGNQEMTVTSTAVRHNR